MKIFLNKVENVAFITLNNEIGMEVTLSTLGASIYDLKVIDDNNLLESIVLYPNNLNEFYTSDGYYGKSVGRFSGRIDKARCEINGKEYILEKNWNGLNSLHGGYEGISFQNFEYAIYEYEDRVDIVFTYLEKENLLPGDVNYKITYQVMKNKNDLVVVFNAKTNKDTLVNLTNHVYFNLSGNLKSNIKNQKLQLLCDRYTNLNNELITVSIDSVNEVFDFRKPHEIGKYIYDESIQNHIALGYDHCWIKEDTSNEKIAVLSDDESRRRLTVSTSYPAIVCYAGCYPKKIPFNENKVLIEQYHSICLECQYIPNGINMENVDKAILKPNEEYNHYIKYSFDLWED